MAPQKPLHDPDSCPPGHWSESRANRSAYPGCSLPLTVGLLLASLSVVWGTKSDRCRQPSSPSSSSWVALDELVPVAVHMYRYMYVHVAPPIRKLHSRSSSTPPPHMTRSHTRSPSVETRKVSPPRAKTRERMYMYGHWRDEAGMWIPGTPPSARPSKKRKLNPPEPSPESSPMQSMTDTRSPTPEPKVKVTPPRPKNRKRNRCNSSSSSEPSPSSSDEFGHRHNGRFISGPAPTARPSKKRKPDSSPEPSAVQKGNRVHGFFQPLPDGSNHFPLMSSLGIKKNFAIGDVYWVKSPRWDGHHHCEVTKIYPEKNPRWIKVRYEVLDEEMKYVPTTDKTVWILGRVGGKLERVQKQTGSG